MIGSLMAMIIVLLLVLMMIDTLDTPGIRKQVITMTMPATLLLFFLSIDNACRFIGC